MLLEIQRRLREKHILPCHSPDRSSSGSGLPLCCLSASATERVGRGQEKRGEERRGEEERRREVWRKEKRIERDEW
jgi:hypothetical protein